MYCNYALSPYSTTNDDNFFGTCYKGPEQQLSTKTKGRRLDNKYCPSAASHPRTERKKNHPQPLNLHQIRPEGLHKNNPKPILPRPFPKLPHPRFTQSFLPRIQLHLPPFLQCSPNGA